MSSDVKENLRSEEKNLSEAEQLASRKRKQLREVQDELVNFDFESKRLKKERADRRRDLLTAKRRLQQEVSNAEKSVIESTKAVKRAAVDLANEEQSKIDEQPAQESEELQDELSAMTVAELKKIQPEWSTATKKADIIADIEAEAQIQQSQGSEDEL